MSCPVASAIDLSRPSDALFTIHKTVFAGAQRPDRLASAYALVNALRCTVGHLDIILEDYSMFGWSTKCSVCK